MAGLTFTPDLYKCGINYVGVTDIALLFDTMPKNWEAARESFKVMVGDPDSEKEFLDQWSPVNHVEKIQAPIFMAYGKEDPRVVLKHAQNLEKEMKKYNNATWCAAIGDADGDGVEGSCSDKDRDWVDDEIMDWIIESGFAHNEEQAEASRERESQQDIIRRIRNE